jgi:hypothetical protein
VTIETAARPEPRWPVALAILCVFGVMAVLPGRIRLFPNWINGTGALIMVLPLLAVSLQPVKPVWQKVERVVMIAAVLLGAFVTFELLESLLRNIIGRTESIGGLALLSSSVAVWALNVLTFSLLYWELDRGGPAARSNDDRRRPDWTFPQESADEDQVAPGWRPVYADYLFLSFSTATAFSTTDVMPFTVRAKMLMMFEAMVSLTTLALVASRAINILGS